MPKNIFEELAITQHKEELARIKILSRIKAGDIKGAHRIAKPYLEKLSQIGNNKPIPTGWLKISKTLCALDIQNHGVSNLEMESFPGQSSWINTALEIVSNRTKGLIKALVPASMALALLVQAFGPTKINAADPPKNITIHEPLDLKDKTENNEISQGLKTELVKQGYENPPKSLNDRLTKEIHISNPEQQQSIEWSVGNLTRNASTKLIEAELVAQNISNSKVSISQFSMTDSRYESCTIKKDSNKLEPLNTKSSPSEIPPNAGAIYKVTIAKTKSPQIMFSTKNGEIHSMKLNLDGFDEFSNPLEKKSWAQFKLVNNSKEPLEIVPKTPDGVNISKLKISDGEKELNIESPQKSLVLKPQQVATLLVEAKENYSPDLELTAKSKNKSTIHKLQTSPLTNLVWSINQTYAHVMDLILSNNEKNLGWEEIKDRFNAVVESLAPKPKPIYKANDLIEKVATGSLLLEPNGMESTQAPLNPHSLASLTLQKRKAKQDTKPYGYEIEVQ